MKQLKTLGLISCTKSKQNYPCKASEMYSNSNLFRKAYAYATKNYDFVAILSAKYGLLFPDDEIEPYNLTLNNMKPLQRKEWAKKVFDQMKSRLRLNDFDKILIAHGTLREGRDADKDTIECYQCTPQGIAQMDSVGTALKNFKIFIVHDY